jgi:manganese/iron transport system permease protein
MLTWILEPLGFEFMRNAIAIAVLLGILCAIVGSYLIVQRMGLLGDVIAHAVLPGLAIAFFLGIDIFIGAFIFGTLSTFVIAWIQSQSRIKVDVAMAIVFSSFLALGIALITILKSKLDLHSFLFGDILGVTAGDVWRTAAIAIAVLAVVALFYKEFLFGLIHLGLTAAITLTIIASMQAVGVVLVVSLLVSPGITAYLLVKELHWMMVLGAVFGIISSVSGMYISYYSNIPSGAAIVLVASGLFFLALLFSPSQGILTRPEMANRSVRQLQQMMQAKPRRQ